MPKLLIARSPSWFRLQASVSFALGRDIAGSLYCQRYFLAMRLRSNLRVLTQQQNSIQLRDPETSLDQPTDYSSYPQLQQSQVLRPIT
ncbi:MAG: hypothetical protein EOO68_17105 [Moraxellaceae bacterium]|nr:MAG: hypothetical protein EOO68_17105 [Moraxellaceae bacterium]